MIFSRASRKPLDLLGKTYLSGRRAGGTSAGNSPCAGRRVVDGFGDVGDDLIELIAGALVDDRLEVFRCEITGGGVAVGVEANCREVFQRG